MEGRTDWRKLKFVLTDGRTYGRLGGRKVDERTGVGERAEGRSDGRTDGRTNGWTYRLADGRESERAGKRTNYGRHAR